MKHRRIIRVKKFFEIKKVFTMNRVKSKRRRCPNPLFEKWLAEWRDEAKAKNSPLESHFTKAIGSLQKYPLPLATGRDCILLQHFGGKLCAMLDKKLKKHLENRRDAHNSDTEKIDTCDDVENDILFKKSKSLEGSALNDELHQKKKKNFSKETNREKNEIAENFESATCALPRSSEKLSNQTTLKNNRVKRKNRIHSLSSSDSDDPKKLPNVEINERITSESTEKIFDRLTTKYDKINENDEIVKKVRDKKRVEEIDVEAKSSTKSIEETDFVITEKFHMAPRSFDIILLVDTHETGGSKTKSKDDQTISELERLNTRYEIRHLKVGDFCWIARCCDTKKELILPYTVERKRMDDLASSIKDGRFHEQKFRLRQSGIPNVIYMIESHGKNQHLGMPLSTLFQASTNSMIQDGFTVKYTESHKHSMQYLSILTTLIQRIFKDKHLSSCSKEELAPYCMTSEKISLMEFKQFNKAASKIKTFKVREMFVRHLLQLKGLSLEKALAIVELYPTPMILSEAFRNAGQEGEKLLAGIKVGNLKRQLGPALSKTIFDLYTKNSLE